MIEYPFTDDAEPEKQQLCPSEEPLVDTFTKISVNEPEVSLPSAVFEKLPEAVRAACARAGWQSLTRVQSFGLPYLLNGRDIMLQSRTGSGKTGCYLLPLLPLLSPDLKATQALALTPTRELAIQVAREATTLFAGSGITTAAVYGGVGYRQQAAALRDGAQVIVGTPGRILDHLLRRSMNLDELRCLIFDEADRLLSIGFYPDMKEVQRCLPPQPVHTCMFSATYPPHVLKLAAEFMRQPAMLSLSHKQVHVAEVRHLFCEVKPMDKDRALVRLLETENPIQAVIFCNTKANVHYVTGVLRGFGYSADEISSDLTQNKREAVLNQIHNGELRYLAATDIAARGIDIPALSHVFLYEPPEDHESYIHRAGRTGRAGAAGTVISLVDVMQRTELERIARHYGIAVAELPLPTDEDVSRVTGARVMAFLEARLRKLTGLEQLRAARYTALAQELASEGEEDGGGLALLAMLLDDFHHGALRENRFPDNKPVRQGESAISMDRRKRLSRRRRSGETKKNA
ncbi:MAG: DEAD/DEAH box helicase [Desulfovibrio sp.]|jgi:ATP-dependent RNA helicase DeaD|nr:DEAD/DEAH box helicase [Desulfovibrio sp.]